MAEIDSENPWVFGGILIGVWIVVSVVTEVLLLNGDLFDAVMWGTFGGTTFVIVFLFLRARQRRK